jgi:hypothetical protein
MLSNASLPSSWASLTVTTASILQHLNANFANVTHPAPTVADPYAYDAHDALPTTVEHRSPDECTNS